MRPIRLPHRPAGGFSGNQSETFEGAISGVIRRAVVIGNGFAGAENQCLGLVRALGLFSRHSLYRITRPRGGFSRWLNWLPVSTHKKVDSLLRSSGDYLRYRVNFNGKKEVPLSSQRCADAKLIAKMARDSFDRDGPILVVASGRDTISIASSIRVLAPEIVFVVQIQHPRSHLNRFDLVITPRHDYYPLTPHAQEQIPWFLRRWITPREPPDRHVVLTEGALHQADSAALRSAASAWGNELAVLPKPLLVVNIGGPTSNCEYGVDLAKQLTVMLQKVLWSCGSVRISFSRRTPERVSKILVKELSNDPKIYIWDGKADSVSMLSEACSTGKPVYVIGAQRCTWKFADFQKRLQEKGVVRPLTGKEDISETWSYPPLNDTAEAASQVIEALAERGWIIEA
ncbi:mitochondrial fission protein ELM1 isoform X2 [Ricinus communis]|uniref:mitochondrial fission protein ELM1 isoform X2 n=1 Tax=Ricinus communis TaxID=3988 RepID=UPI0007724CB6|nr:mitochondrial fission protein ELM1 isoform X2 [Ricinus communis]|eukprot:XP_015581680.1 mitochondrial fission protein ELM1 isoform X2 [Ricinus communis]